LDARLHRLAHRLTLGNTRRHELDGTTVLGDDRPFAVERIAQRIDHAADHGIADRHAQQTSRAAHLVAFVDGQEVAENDYANRVFFQVEREAVDPVGELDHFAGHDATQAVDARNAVTDLQNASDFADVDLGFVLLNLSLYY